MNADPLVLLACTAHYLIAVPSPITSTCFPDRLRNTNTFSIQPPRTLAVLFFFLRLGHQIRPSPRRGRRTPLRLPEDPMLCNYLQPHSQTAVGQSAKPRCSFQRAKQSRNLYRTGQSLALRTRTRKARQSRLDMGWFSPVRAKRCGSISHLFAFHSQCTSTPRSRAEQPDGLDGLGGLVLSSLPLSTRRDPLPTK